MPADRDIPAKPPSAFRGRDKTAPAPYPSASVVVLALVNVVDLAARPTRNLQFIVYLAGLVLGLGALHGYVWQLGQRLLARLPRRVNVAFWFSAALAASAQIADRLGAFNRLGGRYNLLAIETLVACGGAALALGLLFALMQPRDAAPLGRLSAWSARARGLSALVLGLAALACGLLDRHLFPGSYPYLHLALRLCCMWLGMRSYVLLDSVRPLPRVRSAGAALCVLWAALPLVLLNYADPVVLGAFSLRPWASMTLNTSRALLDFDQDGHASLLGGGDCAPFDPEVNPHAREIPGNGIDDNCMLGDAKKVTQAPEVLAVTTTPAPLDVVLITVDSLRPDHLGVYNPIAYGPRGRGTTPNLDAWSRNATVFTNAYTSGGWTSVALPSLMRGLYPRRLQWTRYYETNYFQMLRKPFGPVLRPNEHAEIAYPLAFDDPNPPLAQRLQRRGMFTVAVLDDGYSEIFHRGTGASTGFSVYFETDRHGRGQRGDPATVDLALGALRSMPRNMKFFMWVHLFGVHGPDEVHPGARTYGDTAVDRYDHEVNSMDRELARLLAELDKRPSPPAVFITADHGEELYYGPRHHGLNLDESEIRIPLLARVPGWHPGSVATLVSLVDVVPSILALTRTPSQTHFDGIDLASVVSRRSSPRPLITETWKYDIDGRKLYDYVSARQAEHKIILDRMNYSMISYDMTRPNDTFWFEYTMPNDALARALYGYLDEVGGEPRQRD